MLTIQSKLRCFVNHALQSILQCNLLLCTDMAINIVSASSHKIYNLPLINQ
jgi:hypothetical protein